MKKFLIIIFVVFGIFASIYLVAIFRQDDKNNNNIIVENSKIEEVKENEKVKEVMEREINQCYTEKEFLVKGNSMSPLIRNWEKITILEGFYKGNPTEKWDIVLYDFKWTKKSIIKKIYITYNDKIEIKNNILYLNDEKLKNTNWQQYNFSQAELKVLWMYIKNKHIPKNSYFIFWENINNSIDSRKFWAVSSEDFLGKVILKN